MNTVEKPILPLTIQNSMASQLNHHLSKQQYVRAVILAQMIVELAETYIVDPSFVLEAKNIVRDWGQKGFQEPFLTQAVIMKSNDKLQGTLGEVFEYSEMQLQEFKSKLPEPIQDSVLQELRGKMSSERSRWSKWKTTRSILDILQSILYQMSVDAHTSLLSEAVTPELSNIINRRYYFLWIKWLMILSMAIPFIMCYLFQRKNQEELLTITAISVELFQFLTDAEDFLGNKLTPWIPLIQWKLLLGALSKSASSLPQLIALFYKNDPLQTLCMPKERVNENFSTTISQSVLYPDVKDVLEAFFQAVQEWFSSRKESLQPAM